jgi:hypothetical protein
MRHVRGGEQRRADAEALLERYVRFDARQLIRTRQQEEAGTEEVHHSPGVRLEPLEELQPAHRELDERLVGVVQPHDADRP